MKKTVAAGLLLSILLLLFTSCDIGTTPDNKPRSETWYEYFATVCTVQSFGEDTDENFSAVSSRVKTMLSEYHALYDVYHEYSGINNLKTVNDKAGIEPVKVDARIIELLKYGIELYDRFAALDKEGDTDLAKGAVNIAMGSVLKLWHTARAGVRAEDGTVSYTLPEAEALMLAATHTDISSIVIDEQASTVFITDSETSIDVGAIAKGYTAERIAEALMADSSLSTDGYVLNLGGNIRLIGTKGGEDWRIGITNPDKTSGEPYVKTVEASNTSIVTSGDYERYFTVDGVKYHHIIDPDTLMPATYFHSVTVVTEDSALADALSTLLFTLHINKAYALVTSLEGVEAMWVGTNGTLTATPGFPAVED